MIKFLSSLIILVYILILFNRDCSCSCLLCYNYVLETDTPIDTWLTFQSNIENVLCTDYFKLDSTIEKQF